MNPEPVSQEGWSFLRCVVIALIIFVVQIVAFALVGTTTVERRITHFSPALVLEHASPDILQLENPTLFALPNLQGFSGQAWLAVPPMKYSPAELSEEERWLELRVEKLGSALAQLVRTNTSPFAAAQKVEPEIAVARIAPPNVADVSSTFRVVGPLAQRVLLSAFKLPSWQRSEPLTNSVVEVTLNAAGFVNAAVLLASCGHKAADDFAITLSKGARFAPLRLSQRKTEAQAALSGQIIFEWHTTIVEGTNAPRALP